MVIYKDTIFAASASSLGRQILGQDGGLSPFWTLPNTSQISKGSLDCHTYNIHDLREKLKSLSPPDMPAVSLPTQQCLCTISEVVIWIFVTCCKDAFENLKTLGPVKSTISETLFGSMNFYLQSIY